MGENSCGMAPDYLLLKCSLGYFGNIAPTLEWRARDNGDVIGTGSYITKANVVTSALTVSTLQSFAADTSKFSCRVKMPQPHALMCKPEAIRILCKSFYYRASLVCGMNHSINQCFPLDSWRWTKGYVIKGLTQRPTSCRLNSRYHQLSDG